MEGYLIRAINHPWFYSIKNLLNFCMTQLINLASIIFPELHPNVSQNITGECIV